MSFIVFKPKLQKKLSLVKPTDIVTIYVYFKIPGINEWIEQSTKIKIPYVNWSKVSESIIAAGLNIEQKSSSLKFQQLKAHFDSLLITNKIDPTAIIHKKTWLKEQINFVNGDYGNSIKSKETVPEYFLDWAIMHNNDKIRKDKVKDVSHLTTFINRFKGFEKHQNKRFKLMEIDTFFESIVLEYSKEKWNSVDTQQKFLKRINSTCIWVLDRQPSGRKQLENWVKIELPKNKSSTRANKFTPTEEEITILTKFTAATAWGETVRKAYLIGCKTGLRISDLLRIDPSKNIISQGQGSKSRFWIGINPLKTETTSERPVYVPISRESKKMIEETFPWRWKVSTKSQRSDANTKFNTELKIVFKDAGIDRILKNVIKRSGAKQGQSMPVGDYPAHEVVSSHSARRYASNQLKGIISDEQGKNIFGWGLDSVTAINSYLDPSISQGKTNNQIYETLEKAGKL